MEALNVNQLSASLLVRNTKEHVDAQSTIEISCFNKHQNNEIFA
jgi:hypothetical protein